MAGSSPQYQKVAEANRQYYAKMAQLYETTETCVVSSYDQDMLQRDLDAIMALLPNRAHARALDACGGSGNVALKLMERQLDVTVCDISVDLLRMLGAKALRAGFAPKIVCTEIGSFLEQAQPAYDLIVFSSALHHLEDIDYVLRKALARLKPGGLLYTVFDPTPRQHALTRLVIWLDYLWFKAAQQPNDLIAGVGRRIRRTFSRGGANRKSVSLSDANLGVLAEYHVEKGIDDQALARQIAGLGYELVWHTRYVGIRHALARKVIESVGDVTHFKLLVRHVSERHPHQ